MPELEKSISVEGTNKESILSFCYSSFIALDWPVLFAGDKNLIAFTKQNWRSNSQRIIVTADENSLFVKSEMTGSEMVDISRKNKQNIEDFLTAFESAKLSVQPTEDENNKKAIAQLREETQKAAAEQAEEQAEVAKALNLAGSNLYATYTIIALNILVFILMVADGAGIMEPNGLVHIKWGSNYGPLTLSGDWWRLITNMFIHFGFIHIAMNMYTFYMVGIYLEPLLGKIRYVAAYLCTGVLASITSLWWHTIPANSAGASGAIFGMYGLFLAFLIPKLIPDVVRKGLLQSIVIFIIYNLVYGMKGGVDNSAHIGGLISGFVIGGLYIVSIKKERQGQKAVWTLPLAIALTIAITVFYLKQHKTSDDVRQGILSEIKEIGYKDTEKFNDAYNRFVELQKNALLPMSDTTIQDEERAKQLKEKSMPEWESAANLAKQMQEYDVSARMKSKAGLVLQYIQLREKEISVIDDIVTKKASTSQLDLVRDEINKILEKLNSK
ncbi:MAG: rhomboid family intramembrane serine protease [Chitinophagaceae bacterium]